MTDKKKTLSFALLTKWLNQLGKEEKILKAAEKVFVRDGYDGARMQTIADDAKINKALLHYYFRTKEKLFQKIFQAKISFFLPKIGAAFFSDKHITEKLDVFVDSYMDMLIKHPGVPAFMISTINKYPSMVHIFPKEAIQSIIDYIQVEVDTGNIKKIDPRQFLVSVIGMCVFPFAAKPIIAHIMQLEDDSLDQFYLARKKEVKMYVRAILEK